MAQETAGEANGALALLLRQSIAAAIAHRMPTGRLEAQEDTEAEIETLTQEVEEEMQVHHFLADTLLQAHQIVPLEDIAEAAPKAPAQVGDTGTSQPIVIKWQCHPPLHLPP
jgi:hypothetical protein